MEGREAAEANKRRRGCPQQLPSADSPLRASFHPGERYRQTLLALRDVGWAELGAQVVNRWAVTYHHPACNLMTPRPATV